MATHFLPANLNLIPLANSSSSSDRRSFSTGFPSPSLLSHDFSGHRIRTPSQPKRGGGVVTRVIPFATDAFENPPPDIASYLFKHRIVYLGMILVPQVTELLLAEFLYLNYESGEKPIYFYINSTGTEKDGHKYGYETEAFAVYDSMGFVEAPIFTICIGNAWGEAALLLAAGAKGNRSALPSSTIMMKQPIDRYRGQATDVDLRRKNFRRVKEDLVKILSKHIGKSPEQIEADIRYPKYFSPAQAVEYGIIDKVVYNERGSENGGVLANLARSNLN